MGSSTNQGGKRFEPAHPPDGLIHLPDLVGVDHEARVGADRFTGDAAPANVVLDVRAHLDLDVPESPGDGVRAQPAQLVVAVTQPAGGGGIDGISRLLQSLDAFGLGGLVAAHDRQGFLPGDGVGDVTEIQAADEIFGGHVGQQPPDRFALRAGPHVPNGVDDAADGHVNDAFFGPQPAQLAIRTQSVIKCGDVAADLVQVAAQHEMPHVLDGLAADIVAAPDGEDQAESMVAPLGLDDDVGGRIVRVDVDRIGAVALLGCRKTNIVSGQLDDSVAQG